RERDDEGRDVISLQRLDDRDDFRTHVAWHEGVVRAEVVRLPVGREDDDRLIRAVRRWDREPTNQVHERLVGRSRSPERIRRVGRLNARKVVELRIDADDAWTLIRRG